VFFPSLSSGLFSALGKKFGMPSAIILPSVVSTALSKQLFSRVPDGMHLGNILALGKSPVSGSAACTGASVQSPLDGGHVSQEIHHMVRGGVYF